MKHSIIYTAAAVLGLSAITTACDDNFTYPPVVYPETVDVEANIPLLDFKAENWSSLTSPTTIGTNADGDTIVFTGRVCSSDATGNVFKNIVVQTRDADGEQVAITFSVNEYDLYKLFPFGQEVAVYATGLEIGGYRGLLQFGAISGSEMTFMDVETLKAHVVRNRVGLPEPSKVDTTATTIAEINAAKSSPASLQKWMSRLVRVQGVSFADAGKPFAGTQSVTRYITDATGARLGVRNSSYADFSEEPMPYGTGDVTGILSYFNNDWQIILIDADGCQNFDNIAPEPVPDTEPAGEGTLESPYNVAKALQLAGAMSADDKLENIYVKGKIASVGEVDTGSFGNATYYICDNTGGETLGVYRGYWLGGDKFTSADQLSVGADVVVLGTLVNFKGNTRQLTTGSRIVSYNGQTSGGDTPTPGPSSELYSMLSDALTAMPSDWTIDNASLADGLSYVWSWKTFNERGYLNASAYAAGSAKASEAYAISPVLDLTGATGCSLTFEHAAKFQTTLRTLCGVVAREEGAKEWTALTIPTWPDAGAWTFANSGSVSLAAFDGKKIQIAFKYGSTADGADTWEIKNLKINGSK